LANSLTSKLTGNRFVLFLVALTLGLNLLTVSLSCIFLVKSRQLDAKNVAVATQNLTQVLEQNITGVINKADVGIFALAQEVARQIASGGVDGRKLARYMAQAQSLLPELEGLRVADERGRVRYGLDSPSGGPYSCGDRDYFKQLRDNPGEGLVVSRPVKGRITGKWIIILARRISRPDGSFAGVAFGAFALDRMDRLFTSIDAGKHGAFALRDGRDLALVARYPEPEGTGSAIGQTKMSNEFLELQKKGVTAGTYDAPSGLDRRMRAWGFRKFADQRYFIFVGLDRNELLAEWRKEVFGTALYLVLFALVSTVTSRCIYLAWQRNRAAEDAQRASNLALLQSESALTEAQRVAHIGNWRWDANTDEIWWSDELCRIYEKAPGSAPSFEEAQKNYTPESAARLAAAVQKAWQTGEPYIIELERSVVTGPKRWIQARGEAVRNASGAIEGLRGTAQDITGLKEAQDSTKRYAKRLITLEEDLRKKIATELHDDVGQEITALSLNLAFIAKHLGKEAETDLRPVLDEARVLAKRVNSTVRGLMNALRPTQLDEYGLVSALRTYTEQFAQRTGIAVTLQAAPGFPRLGSRKETALFRISQEALNNVVKHAAATKVTVVLDSDGNSPRLTITDNGNGLVPKATPRPPGSGYGLTIMRERTALADGRFRISSAPGMGTSVVIELEGE